MSISRIFTGGCQCGAVRYRVEGTLADPHLCHCRMCQKAAGNYFLPLANAPRERISVTRGKPGWFKSSDIVRRGFCRDCGTPLFFRYVDKDRISVSLGSLDEPLRVAPAKQYGLESRLPFVAGLTTLPGSRTEDEVPPERMAQYKSRQHRDGS